MLHSIPCLFLCLTIAQPPAALEIANIRPTYGYLGSAKAKGEGVLPGETAHFTFEIKNLMLDESGKALYSIAIEIRDAEGKVFYEQRPRNSIAINYLGGSSLPCSAHIEIPLNTKPGTYDWKLTIKDRTSKQSTSVSGKSKVLPADFGIVQVGLFADVESRVPMSAVGVVGDSAYIQFALVGFERAKDSKQPDLLVSMRILDEQGKSTMTKAMTGEIKSNVGAKDGTVAMHFGMTFNRAGRYTVELTAEDRVTSKRSQIRYTIRVLPLE